MCRSTLRPTDGGDQNTLTTNSQSEALQVTYAESFPSLMFTGKYVLIYSHSSLLQALERCLSRCYWERGMSSTGHHRTHPPVTHTLTPRGRETNLELFAAHNVKDTLQRCKQNIKKNKKKNRQEQMPLVYSGFTCFAAMT